MYEPVLRRLVGEDYLLAGDEAHLLCPVHEKRTGKADHSPSFYFNIETGLCFCHSCKYKGNAYTLWRDLRGEELEELEEPTEEEWVTAMRRRLDRVQVHGFTLPTIMDEEDLTSFIPPTEEMLRSRKISRQAAAELGLLSYRGAWVIPIRHTSSNILMGIQVKDGPVVRNIPDGVKKILSLFGLNVEPISTDATLIVESPLDVAVLRTIGISAVATYGSYVSDEQMRHLISLPNPVLAFDNDKAGKIAHEEVADYLLSQFVEVYAIEWPDDMVGKDPGDNPDIMPVLLDNAVNLMAQRLRKALR